jgi:hypothetical protein
MSALLDAALAYAAHGWPVFPVQPRGKAPLCEHGCKDATVDVDRIVRWWSRWPDANVAVETGIAFDVLDVDDLDAGEELFGGPDVELPSGPAALTPSGVVHLYFAPTGLGNRVKFVNGCDFRGVGGYVIVPPSIGANGEPYRWWPFDDGWRDELVPVPGWLRLLLERPQRAPAPPRASHPFDQFRRATTSAYVDAALDDECRKAASAPEGTRNHQLNRSAFALGQLVAAGRLDASIVFSRLLGAALHAGLGEPEARRTIASGLQAGFAQPREVS